MDRELGDTIPAFNQPADQHAHEVDITNLSALTSTLGGIRTWAEIGASTITCRDNLARTLRGEEVTAPMECNTRRTLDRPQ